MFNIKIAIKPFNQKDAQYALCRINGIITGINYAKRYNTCNGLRWDLYTKTEDDISKLIFEVTGTKDIIDDYVKVLNIMYPNMCEFEKED